MPSGVLLTQKTLTEGVGIKLAYLAGGGVQLAVDTTAAQLGQMLVKTELGLGWQDPASASAILLRQWLDVTSEEYAAIGGSAYIQDSGLVGDGTEQNPLGLDIPQLRPNEWVFWQPGIGGWGIDRYGFPWPTIVPNFVQMRTRDPVAIPDNTFDYWFSGYIKYYGQFNQAVVMAVVPGTRDVRIYERDSYNNNTTLGVTRGYVQSAGSEAAPFAGHYFINFGGGMFSWLPSKSAVGAPVAFDFPGAKIYHNGTQWCLDTIWGEPLYRRTGPSNELPSGAWTTVYPGLTENHTISITGTSWTDVTTDRVVSDWTDVTDTWWAQYSDYLAHIATTSNPALVTRQGNTFNNAGELVQLRSDSKLPALDGSLLTNLPFGQSLVRTANTTRELTADDIGQTITVTSSSAVTLSIPFNMVVGTKYTVVKCGSGKVSIAADASENIMDSTSGGTLFCDLSSTYIACTIQKITSTQWVVINATGVWETA